MTNAKIKSARAELELADQALGNAKAILPIRPGVAAREAYLAAFHAAQARLAASGNPVPSSHKGVNMMIGAAYKGTDFAAQATLSRLEDWKEAADYGKGRLADSGDAKRAIDLAEHFIQRVRTDIGPQKQTGLSAFEQAALAAKMRDQGR